MGLLDTLKSALGGSGSSEAFTVISALLSQTNLGGFQGIVSQLQKAGLDSQVKSWLGNGTNMPISAEQLQAVLSNEQVQSVAKHFGLPVDQALNLLAQHLPAAVDQASPNGTLST